MAMSVTVNARVVLVLMIRARIHRLSEPARELGAEVANLVALPGRARTMVIPSHPRHSIDDSMKLRPNRVPQMLEIKGI